MRNDPHNSVEESKHTFYVQRHLSKNPGVYVIMCKIVVEPYRTQMTVWRMRFACCIP